MNEWNDIEQWLKQQQETQNSIEQITEILATMYDSLIEKGLSKDVAAQLTAVFLNAQLQLGKK